MPIGKEMGTFSLTTTSITNLPSEGGFLFGQVNLEGTVTGELTGTVLLTMNFKTSDMKGGTYTSVAAAFLESGDTLNGEGSGCYESSGAHKWRMRGHDVLSNGSIIALEAEMDLASRTYSGKIYTWD